MKHLKALTLNEARSPEIKPIGFVLYIRSTWYYGAFATFEDFASKVYEDFTGSDVDDLDEEFLGDMGSLQDVLYTQMDGTDETMTSDISNSTFWWTMNPKCALNILHDHSFTGNPYSGARTLDLAFTGLKTLMTEWPNGMDSDAGYVGTSIQNDPSQLEHYLDCAEDESAYFTKEDIIGSIKGGSKELQALVKYHKIKGLI